MILKIEERAPSIRGCTWDHFWWVDRERAQEPRPPGAAEACWAARACCGIGLWSFWFSLLALAEKINARVGSKTPWIAVKKETICRLRRPRCRLDRNEWTLKIRYFQGFLVFLKPSNSGRSTSLSHALGANVQYVLHLMKQHRSLSCATMESSAVYFWKSNYFHKVVKGSTC